MSLGLITLGDSVGLPRPGNAKTAEVVDDAWPHLLFNAGTSFSWHWHLGLGAWRAPQIVEACRASAPHLRTSAVGLVVAQFGIVDCYPRWAPYWIQALFYKLGMKELFRSISRNPAAYKLGNRPYTSVKRFRRAVNRFVNLWSGNECQIVFVGVIPPGLRLTQLVGDFDYLAYNRVLEDSAAEHDHVHVLTANLDLIEDGHHLSLSGHKDLATLLHELWVRLPSNK